MLLDRFIQCYSLSVQTLFMAMLKVKEDKAFELYYTQHLCIYLEVPPNISIQNLYEDFCSFTVTSKWRAKDELHVLVPVTKETESKCLTRNRIYFVPHILMCKSAESIPFLSIIPRQTSHWDLFSFQSILLFSHLPTVCLYLIPYCTISSASHFCSYRNLLHPTLSAFF